MKGIILVGRSGNRLYSLTKVILVTMEEYGLSKAVRPFNSRLNKSKLVRLDLSRFLHGRMLLADI